MAFLIEALKGGPRLASELTAEAEKAGINGRTLRRAFKELGGEKARSDTGTFRRLGSLRKSRRSSGRAEDCSQSLFAEWRTGAWMPTPEA